MVLVSLRRRWLGALTFLLLVAGVLLAPTADAAAKLARYRVHIEPHDRDARKLRLKMQLCYRDAARGEQAKIDARQLTTQVRLLSVPSLDITAAQGVPTDLDYRRLDTWPDEQDGRRTGALRLIIPPARADGCSDVRLVFEHEPGTLSYTWAQRFVTLEHAHDLDPASNGLELTVDVPAGTSPPSRYRCERHGDGQRCGARFGAGEPVLVPLGPTRVSTLEWAGLVVAALLLGTMGVLGARRERERDRWRRPVPLDSPPPQVATYRTAPPSEEATPTPSGGVISAMGRALRRDAFIALALVACLGPALALMALRLDQRPQLACILAAWPGITFAQVVLRNGGSTAHLVWPALLVALAWWQPTIGIAVGLIILVPVTGFAFLMGGGAHRER
ncbi:MAG: hypothetical protein JRI68_11035 [Deltaproteobacteria bacterium]|nr:hypothetical protein [Deltaproteobacteria bacterium]